MEVERTAGKPLGARLKRRLFSSNNGYLQVLTTGDATAALVVVLQNIQMLALTSVAANPHTESWIAASMSIVNLENIRTSGTVLHIANALTALVNMLLVAALLALGRRDELKLFVARMLQVYCRLTLVPNMGNYLHAAFLGSEYLYIALPALLLQTLLYLNCELLYFNFSLESKDSLGRNPRTPFQCFGRLFVVVCGILPMFRWSQPAFMVLVILNVGYGAQSVRLNCSQCIYGSPWLSKLEGVCQVLTLGVNSCYLLMWVAGSDMIEGNRLVLVVAAQLFILKFFLNFRNHRLKSLINESSQVAGELEADLYFKLYMSIFRAVSNKKEKLYISSLLKMHINHCDDPECCCKRRSQLYDPTKGTYGSEDAQPHQDLVFVKHYLLKVLRSSLDRFPTSVLLNLDLGFYHLEVLRMYNQTTAIIQSLAALAKKGRCTLSQETLIAQLEGLLAQVLEAKNRKSARASLEIENIRLFDERLHELSKLVVAATSYFSDMWELIAGGASKVQQELSQVCERNLRTVLEVDRLNRELIEINSFSTELKDLMELYARFVLFDYQLLSEVGKQIRCSLGEQRMAREKDVKLSTAQMFSSQACMLSISHSPDNIGEVLWANKNVRGVLGYSRQELIKSSINRIIPGVFRKYHDSILLNWREKGVEFGVNRFKEAWAINSENYCVCCRIYTKVIPTYTEEGLQLLGFIERIGSEGYIVMDEEGDISCVSSEFCSMLKLEPAQLGESYLNIQLLCAELLSSFKLAGQELPKLTALKSQPGQEQSLVLAIPKKLPALLKTLMFKKQNLYSNCGLDVRSKNYHELNEYSALLMRINYLLYLKAQMQLMAEEDCEFYRARLVLEKLQFYNGDALKQFSVIRIVSIKPHENGEIKYLDSLDNIVIATEAHIAKLKGVAKQMELKNREEQELHDNKDPIDSKPGFHGFRGIRTSKLEGATEKDKKKLASLTVKLLKSPGSGAAGRKHTKKNRRESEPLKIVRDAKPIDQDRVAQNIHRLKLSLIRQGILSLKLLDAFNLTREQTMFVRHRLNIFTMGARTGLDIESNDGYEQQPLKSSDKLVVGELLREQDIKLGSVASSTANISMNSAIKSLKEELRKLRPPDILVGINRILIGTLAALLMLFAFDCLTLLNKSSKYLETVRATEQTHSLQQRLRMSFDTLLLRANIGSFNATSGWQQELLERSSEYLAEAGEQLLAQNQQSIRTPSILRANSLSYRQLQFSNGRTQGPYHFVLLQLYTAYKALLEKPPQGVPLLNDFSRATYAEFSTLIDESMHLNFGIIGDSMDSIRQYIIYIGLAEQAILTLVIVVLLVRVQKLLKKITDTLNLFSKISQRDIARYQPHFASLKGSFESGSSPSDILENLNSIADQPTPGHHLTASSQKLPSTGGPTKKAPIYLKIAVLVLSLMAVLGARVVICSMLIGQFKSVTSSFEGLYSLENDLLARRVQFKLALLNFSSMSRADFDVQFRNKEQLLPAQLAGSYKQRFAQGGYTDLLLQIISSDICRTVLNLPQGSSCSQTRNRGLTTGIIDELVNINTFMWHNGRYLIEQHQPSLVLLNPSYRQLETSYHYISEALGVLHQQMVSSQTANIWLLREISVYYLGVVACLLLLGLTLGWRLLYTRIAKEASFANAFLLLMPYSLLKENPYVKVYIKNEFNLNGLSRI